MVTGPDRAIPALYVRGHKCLTVDCCDATAVEEARAGIYRRVLVTYIRAALECPVLPVDRVEFPA